MDLPGAASGGIVSADDRQFLEKVLRALAPLDEEALAALAPSVRAVTLDAKEPFLQAGDSAERVGLVRSGVVRELYVTQSGDERTRAFCLPGDFCGSLADALAGRPARCFVRAEVPSRVLVVRWSEVAALEARFPAWQALARRIVERLYQAKAQREYELLALDATERYLALLARAPNLEAVVSQQLVASYLGVTPVHLSRIRRRLGTTRR